MNSLPPEYRGSPVRLEDYSAAMVPNPSTGQL